MGAGQPLVLGPLAEGLQQASSSTPHPSVLSAALHSEILNALLAKNQFLDAAALTARLKPVLATFRAELSETLGAPRCKAEVERALERALAPLAAWVLQERSLLPVVVASEYSAELQLRLLDLSLERLMEPVLDVGCGEGALLVRALRAAGIDATGIDRAAPEDVAERADWLAFDYGVRRYGTIVSHLGFSLHFIHQHLRSARAAQRYAETYMLLLGALRPDGVLAYAPGLPFIEEHLQPSRHRVTKVPLPPELSALLGPLNDTLGLDVSYAASVLRVGGPG